MNDINTIYALFVDLDGTLISNDCFRTALFRLIRQKPLNTIISAIRSLPHGRAFFKTQIANAVPLNPSDLEYNQDVIDLISRFRSRGIPVVIATAAAEADAIAVDRELMIFDDIIASSITVNQKGSQKLRSIHTWLSENNLHSFAYVGDSRSDRVIWAAADLAIVIDEIKLSRLRPSSTELNRKYVSLPQLLADLS